MRPGLAVVLAALFAVSACGDLAPSDELSAARNRWESWGPASYDLTVTRSCECQWQASGPVVVRVRNGAIESRAYLGPVDQVWNESEFGALFPDVPGLFSYIEGVVAGGGELAIEYDEVTGYPRQVASVEPSGAVDGMTITVNLVARP